MTEIKKAVLGSVRLDSDIWEAIKKMPLSLNQYLRKSLSAGGMFEPEPVTKFRDAGVPAGSRITASHMVDDDGRPAERSSRVGKVTQSQIDKHRADVLRGQPESRLVRKPLLKPKDRKR